MTLFNFHSGRWSPYWVHSALRPLLAYSTCPGWLWGWKTWWNKDWQGKQKYSVQTCPSTTLSTTNPTWADPGANSGHCSGKPATNRFNYGAPNIDDLLWNLLMKRLAIKLTIFWKTGDGIQMLLMSYRLGKQTVILTTTRCCKELGKTGSDYKTTHTVHMAGLNLKELNEVKGKGQQYRVEISNRLKL
jgi:hypothetical protein